MLISLASAVGLAILFWMGCCYLVYRFMPRRRQRLAIQAADRAEAEDKAEMRREVAPPPRVRLNFTRAHGVDAADFAAPSRPVTANEVETMPIEDLEGRRMLRHLPPKRRSFAKLGSTFWRPGWHASSWPQRARRRQLQPTHLR